MTYESKWKSFFDLVLQLRDLSEKETLIVFMDGLKPWTKQELQHRGMQKLTWNTMVV